MKHALGVLLLVDAELFSTLGLFSEKKKNGVDGSGEEAELVHCLPSTHGALSWVPTVKLGRVTRGANPSTPGG